MSNLNIAKDLVDITPDNTTASSNHQATKGAVTDDNLAEKSLDFMAPTEHRESEGSSSSSSGIKGHNRVVPRIVEPHIPWFQMSSTSRNLTSTPPPEEIPVTQAQLISGAGCLFPSLPPSRASSLTVSSEGALPCTECPTTPRRASRTDTADEAIRPGESDDFKFSTPVIQRKHDLLFSLESLWTPPPSSPRPTREGGGEGRRQGKNKRASSTSPPPSPRPPKLARFSRWQGSSMSSVPCLAAEDEGYCGELPSNIEQVQQMVAFRNARERAFVLASSTSADTRTGFLPTVMGNHSTGGKFHIFGSSLVSGENDGNDGDDGKPPSIQKFHISKERSSQIPLRKQKRGNPSPPCQ